MSRRLVLWTTFAICILASCNTPDTTTLATGEVEVTVHGGESPLPPQADSAFVGIFGNATPTDVVGAVAIASSAATTMATLVVPSGTSDELDVVAFHGSLTGSRIALAAGEVAAFSVSDGDNPVSVAVTPWSYVLTGPDTLRSGQSAQFTLTVTGGAPVDHILTDHGTLHFRIGPSGVDQRADFTRTGNTAVGTFTAPAVGADTAVYFGFAFDVNEARFKTTSPSFVAEMPAEITGVSLFRRPILALEGGARRVH